MPAAGPFGEGGRAIWNPDGTYTYFLYGTWAAVRPYSIVQITNGGKVLGQSTWEGNDEVYPWVWSPEHGLVDLAGSGKVGFLAYGMNDSGRVVGLYQSCFNATTAVVFDVDRHRMHWLDPEGAAACRSSIATAVNDTGDVVGRARTGGGGYLQPYIWNETDGRKRLSGSVAPDRGDIDPTDINNRRQVVGRFNRDGGGTRISLFYWDETNHFHDLKDLLDPDDPMTAQVILDGGNDWGPHYYTPDINERGEILVTGSLRGEPLWDAPRHAFLLVPVKKP